ncbi:hypothetical protein [Vibrio parahaemolyticus]|uniref:hypothetical protein n=2 Tax=Vibrio parahaemolyticus TaxID=670 RepID=UPI00146CDA3B|nr:hypothetical protein [Vibrio parahaemolyticus]MCR9664960.1 hypothetical protein [Vibrio parahaemolyticus]MCR9678821.1 hypothetical protein [Vibrio parahaemolyticus]MDF4988440.1 hypothetical protein [Vibrio parahaemolyticus]MDF5093755.1 hypothetical protein [Vibrio parahaemolyticus]MDF5138722.1 hypothetical protein [Vibrio parahaemolyticus]
MNFSLQQYNQFCTILDSYRVHALMVEDFLASQIHELKEKIEDTDSSSVDMSIGVHDAYLEEIEVIFPSIQRRAEVIVSYSVLEHQMQQICGFIEKELDSLVKLKDLASNGIIDQCQKYLEKVVSVSFPKQEVAWQEILFIQQIRNSLVHADGTVKTGNKALRGYISQNKYLDISKDNKVVLLAGFTVHCVDIYCHFLTDLYVSMSGEN